MLAIRGWGPDAFERTSSAFLAAARFAVYAERMVPVLDEAERVMAMSPKDLSVNDQAKLGSARLVAQSLLEQARAALMPEDDGG